MTQGYQLHQLKPLRLFKGVFVNVLLGHGGLHHVLPLGMTWDTSGLSHLLRSSKSYGVGWGGGPNDFSDSPEYKFPLNSVLDLTLRNLSLVLWTGTWTCQKVG